MKIGDEYYENYQIVLPLIVIGIFITLGIMLEEGELFTPKVGDWQTTLILEGIAFIILTELIFIELVKMYKQKGYNYGILKEKFEALLLGGVFTLIGYLITMTAFVLKIVFNRYLEWVKAVPEGAGITVAIVIGIIIFFLTNIAIKRHMMKE